MLIRFLGADRTVTGSAHLLEVNGLRILLDCGMYQGARAEARIRNAIVPPDPQAIDAVILSHGHLDHCGRLPALLLAGFRGPIYCTDATAEVARIILEDSAEIQEEDAAYLNRRSIDPRQPPIKPLYRVRDVPAVIGAFKRMPRNQKIDLGKGVSFTFYDAGHILGSCYVVIEWTEANQQEKRTLLFTADIGRYDTPIIRDPEPPPAPVDLIISESTYGGRSHGPIAAVEPQLLEALQKCIVQNSRLLIPSFAVGRTQTVLWYIAKLVGEKKIPPIRIYIDSPMGVETSHVYAKFNQHFDEQTTKMLGGRDLLKFSNVTLATTGDESRRINADRGPCVIIASSPTCEFGRILHHLTQSVEKPKDMIVFVGFIPPGTLGRRLQSGQKRVRILDRWYDVRCEIRTIHGLSAHADADELIRFITPAIGANTSAYVVHGEVDQAEAFATRLVQAGAKSATIPAMETSSVIFAASDQPKLTGAPTKTDND